MDEQVDGRVGAPTPDGVRRSRLPARVIVLNGGSSSGKTTLARALQEELDGLWLRLGVDTLSRRLHHAC